jgi:hypothetical protein
MQAGARSIQPGRLLAAQANSPSRFGEKLHASISLVFQAKSLFSRMAQAMASTCAAPPFAHDSAWRSQASAPSLETCVTI